MVEGHTEDREDRSTALAMLREAGLTPPDDELGAVLANYAGFRVLARRLEAVAEAKYEVPAVTFDPRPTMP